MLRYTTSSSVESFTPDAPPKAAAHPPILATTRPAHLAQDNAPIGPAPRSLGQEPNYLLAKLSAFDRFDDEEAAALDALARNAKPFHAEHVLIHEGSAIDSIYVIVSGLAYRYKMLADGRRQILGYLIPGDLCDLNFTFSGTSDHCVGLLSNSSVARIPFCTMLDVMARFPKISRALAMAAIVDANILREWLLSVGQRDAVQKLSHFFCEMAVRLEAIGAIAADGSIGFPVNQVGLADTLGLTSVHINRTLQRLRSSGLISLRHRRLTILDRERLASVAGFNGGYLRLRPATG